MGKGKIERFEDVVVWQRSMDLVVRVYEICKIGQLNNDWGLKNQMQRAAVSVPANIAEGFEKENPKEFNRYVMIAKGSAGELRCLFQIADRLHYIDDEVSKLLINETIEISRMLNGLSKALKRKS